jgi:hypothetical protein
VKFERLNAEIPARKKEMAEDDASVEITEQLLNNDTT